MLIYEDRCLLVFYENRNSDFNLITFSPRWFAPDGERFWGREIAAKMDLNVVGVVAKGSNWFPEASMQQAGGAIRASMLAGKAIVTYGSSMGAFAALKYSCLLGATTAIAFSPQISINPRDVPFDQRYDYYYRGEFHRDMRIASEDLSGIAYLFYDPWWSSDRRHVDLIGDLTANHRKIPVYMLGHTVVDIVAGTSRIEPLIAACNLDDLARVKTLARAFKRTTPTRAMIAAHLNAPSRPYLALEILKRHDKTTRRGETLPIYKSLIDDFVGKGDFRSATEAARRALSLDPGNARFLQIAETLERGGV